MRVEDTYPKKSNPENISQKSSQGHSHFLAWDKEYRHVTWGGPRSISMLDDYLSSSSMLLDLGCGTGRYLLPLSRKYDYVVGTDVSANAVLRARSYLRKNNSRVTFGGEGMAECLISSITCLPFSDSSFDAVMCLGVLQHLFEAERRLAMDEVKRILKSGGIFIIEVFGVRDMRYGGDEIEKGTFCRKSGIVYHYFTKEEVTSLLCAFDILEIKDTVSEKSIRGKPQRRHHIRAIARI